MWTPTISNCDNYLQARTGKYEFRSVRYRAALAAMRDSIHGLTDSDTIMDIGAGWTELDYCLRTEGQWKGRYIPVDGGIDGTDLNTWEITRHSEWIVALEILEHIQDPWRLLIDMKEHALKGVVVSTPNPETTDVLGMDPTHVVAIPKNHLELFRLDVSEESFYGMDRDSLFGVWLNHEYA